MDEVDLDLENYEELFGMALSHSEELFENGGIDSLFGTKDMSAGDFSCEDAIAAEVINSSHLLSVIVMAFSPLEHHMLCSDTSYDVLVYSQMCICFLLDNLVFLNILTIIIDI